MLDKTTIGNNENAQAPSKAFREYIESLVEEIVLNAAVFNDHKKYLQRYSHEEGLDYAMLEKSLTEFFETVEELKSNESKAIERFAKMLAKDCYLEESKVDELVSAMNEARKKEAKRIAAEKKAEEERIAREKAEREAAEEAKRKAKEEAERKKRKRIEAERKAKEEAERKASEEAERKVKEEKKQNNSEQETTNSFNGHEYVDLSLPSGTLWATCNVGANKPEDYGDYLSWNEGKTAAAKWGDGWRMPSREQWEELKENTKNTRTKRNGVKGRLFTANNGNSVFLPAAGLRCWESKRSTAGSRGYYWSRSLVTDFSDGAWYLGFDLVRWFGSDRCFNNLINRYYGFSVRPVREK